VDWQRVNTAKFGGQIVRAPAPHECAVPAIRFGQTGVYVGKVRGEARRNSVMTLTTYMANIISFRHFSIFSETKAAPHRDGVNCIYDP